jgi:putative oxidoreductase
MLQRYPFVSLNAAFVIARIMTALFFMAHAWVRIANGTIPQFGKFMESVGFPQGELWVWAITLTELACGTMLILGRWVRWATIPLATIVIVGVGLIHVHLGWFVGEHGTGGMEYSVALLVLLLLIAARDREG